MLRRGGDEWLVLEVLCAAAAASQTGAAGCPRVEKLLLCLTQFQRLHTLINIHTLPLQTVRVSTVCV